MSTEVTNTDLNPKSTWSKKLKLRLWLVPAATLVLGVAGGYLYADRNNDELEARFNTQASLEKDRVYVNDTLDFSLIIPASWVNNVIISNDGPSANFFFKNSGTGDQSRAVLVFTIYKCTTADFESLKGQTTDKSKCPGRFLDRDDKATYTWKESNQKSNLTAGLKSSDSVIDEFNRQVVSSFRIVK